SRRASVILGMFLTGLAFVLIGAYPHFYSVAAGAFLFGLASTFISGAIDAWLADEIGSENLGPAYFRAAQLGYAGALAGIAVGVSLATLWLTLPIQGAGVHTRTEGSTKAIGYFLKVLELAGKDTELAYSSRWLLNIAYMTLGEYPGQVPRQLLIDPRRFESDEEFPRFRNVAKKLGLDSLNMSGGAICDDFDGDGDLDIVTSDWGPSGQILFFRNDGDGTFSRRTEEAGLTGIYGGLNLKQADYDNDGDLDVLVLRGAWLGEEGRVPNSLLRNDGKARFSDVSYDAGIAGVDYPTQTASWGVFDLDGYLDLYVGNENHPCQLFHNNGDGTFSEIAAKAGVENGGFTKGVIWGDFDQDRYPDLYVSNYESANRLYRNQGDGTFTDVSGSMGVTRPVRSFPVWFWDFDNDGLLDLWVGSSWWDLTYLAASTIGLPHEAELACLYRGTKGGGFEEVSRSRNLTRLTMPMGCNFGDIDNDGYLDFYLGTGYPEFEGLMPNVMYRNREGRSFADVSAAGGFGHLQKGHAISFADLDNDGDADVFSQLGGAYPADAFRNTLYENPGFGKHWIKVRLVGRESNRFGVGSRLRVVVVEGGKTRSIYRHVNSGGSFGANPLRQEIGVGDATRISVLEVFWPKSNLTQEFRDVAVDQTIEITEGEEEFRRLRLQKFRFIGS
ncbi:MAG: FG-GAP-like repeat-containing protein, partial [Planctomycetota bacterium]|nr:FG-GAP-like repeat-containing protein [Planctomycetota bacterium]